MPESHYWLFERGLMVSGGDFILESDRDSHVPISRGNELVLKHY